MANIIRCINRECNCYVVVPNEAFDWLCNSVGCKEAGVKNDSLAKACHVCECPKITLRKEPDVKIACGACGTVQDVPRSSIRLQLRSSVNSAKQQLAGAKQQIAAWAAPASASASSAKERASSAKEQVLNSVRPPPESMACPHCTSIVQLPANLGPEEKDRELTCPVCTMMFVAPLSSLWEEAKEVIGKGISSARARPIQFNCEHCMKLLNTPQGVDKIWCDGCGRDTTVPSSSFANEIRRESLVVARSLVKAYYYVRDTPYITCPICHAVVRAGQPGFACQNCGCEQGTNNFNNQPTDWSFHNDNHFDGGLASTVEVR